MFMIIIKLGSLLCAIATVCIVGSQLVNARLWLKSYPKPIQNAVPPRTNAEKCFKLISGIPFMLALIGLPIIAALIYRRTVNPDPGFFQYFLILFSTSFMFNVYDLLVLDWLIFCFITPAYQVIEGSEHLMKEYKNYSFHLKGFYMGSLMGIVYSLLAALGFVILS